MSRSRAVAFLQRAPDMNPTFKIEHILVAHDFSENADVALQHALSIATTYKARITILHAYDVSTFGYPAAYFPNFSDFVRQVETAAREETQKIASKLRDWNVRVDTTIVSGSPAREIVTFAEQAKVDLIVMGTHGRRGISHVLLGSVAEKVIRTARCPVLTVPAAGRVGASNA